MGVDASPDDAQRWYREAAKLGSLAAQYQLALKLFNFEGEPINTDEARHWLTSAAEGGFTKARLAIGLLYSRGLGVEHDLIKSYAWLSAAAADGDHDALEHRDAVDRQLDTDARAQAQALARELSQIP